MDEEDDMSKIRNGGFGHKVLCGKKRNSTTKFGFGTNLLYLPGEEASWCDGHGFLLQVKSCKNVTKEIGFNRPPYIGDGHDLKKSPERRNATTYDC
ncbi:hypothetical protein N7513_000340 [Penicillium frequentans]|nr:hypothetical protein N7513_000340 [Penicillium glabrum]